jgi:hypothetical protein
MHNKYHCSALALLGVDVVPIIWCFLTLILQEYLYRRICLHCYTVVN